MASLPFSLASQSGFSASSFSLSRILSAMRGSSLSSLSRNFFAFLFNSMLHGKGLAGLHYAHFYQVLVGFIVE